MLVCFFDFTPGSEPARLAEEQLEAAREQSDHKIQSFAYAGYYFHYNCDRAQWYLEWASVFPEIPPDLNDFLYGKSDLLKVIMVVFTNEAIPLDRKQAIQGLYFGSGPMGGCIGYVDNRVGTNGPCQCITVTGTLEQFAPFTIAIRQRRLLPEVRNEPRWWRRRLVWR